MPVSSPFRMLLPTIACLLVSACGAIATPPPSSTASPGTPAPATTPAPTATPVSSFASGSPAAGLEGQIVFEDVGQDFQFTQIWIENADGSNVRKVVSDGFTDNSASLSPDGRTIVFYQLADQTGFGAIMAINADGTGLHEINTGARAKGCDAGPEGTDAWSPDGRRLTFARTCFTNDGTYLGQGLWTSSLDGTELQQVTHNAPSKPCPPPYDGCPHVEDHRAVWSPDGKSLAFERIDTSVSPERAAIFTIGTDGKHLQQVTPWSLDGNDPDWSPDGTLIALNASAEPSPTQNIWTIHPDGTGLTQLTTFDEDGQATYHPSWSPDGSQILFSHSPSTGGWADFFVMDRDGGNQRVIAKTATHENHGQWGGDPTP